VFRMEQARLSFGGKMGRASGRQGRRLFLGGAGGFSNKTSDERKATTNWGCIPWSRLVWELGVEVVVGCFVGRALVLAP